MNQGEYIKERIDDQIEWYNKKVLKTRTGIKLFKYY